jgi:hypothetical protein
MRRAVGWAVLLWSVGCQGKQLSFDPFTPSGPTLMPPPATGSAGRPDPYYRPSAPQALPAAPSLPGASPPLSSAPTSPPAQFARFTSAEAPAMPSPAVNVPAAAVPTLPPAASAATGSYPVTAQQPTPMNPTVSGSASQIPQALLPSNTPGNWSSRY